MKLSDLLQEISEKGCTPEYSCKLVEALKVATTSIEDSAYNFEPCISCNRMGHAQEALEKIERILK